MDDSFDIAVVRDPQAFAALEEEWEDLYRDSPLSTPFQSWAWLFSWWESYGEGYELRLVTVRNHEGLLVGIIPLMLERKLGFRRLLFIGKITHGHVDLLARKGWEAKVCEAGVRALRQMSSWHVADVARLSPAAAAWGIFQRWDGPRTHAPTTHYLFIEVKPWDELLMSLSRNHRSSVRRALRRAEEDGVRSVLAEPEEAERAACRLLALHREQRQGQLITQEHLTTRYESFIVAAARRMTDCGLGGISEFRRDGEVVISSFTVFGHKVTYAYLVGARRDAIQRYQWSSLGICDVLNMARSRKSTHVCLAGGRHTYKQRWAPEEVPIYRIVLGREPVSWASYLTCLSLHTRGAEYLEAGSVSKLIKNVKGWLKRR
jgi:CelD/BcsL family acetyltransferase involved in cellulose biosynthesis